MKSLKSKLMNSLELELLARKGFETKKEFVALGFGNINADIMLIGINPNRNIDYHGVRCFYDGSELTHHRSSNILIPILHKYLKNQYYITNVVKIPSLNNNIPSENLIPIFVKYLKREIAIVQPKLIISLGNWVYETLKKYNIYSYKVWHPAYVARNLNLYDKYDKQFVNILTKFEIHSLL